jgi:hypothetical protein
MTGDVRDVAAASVDGPGGMRTERTQVAVIGGTAAGVAASIGAARQGASVVLVEPGQHLGGLMTSGLGRTDIGHRATVGGVFRQLVNRLREYYVERYGPDSPPVKDCGDGYELEPSVAEQHLEEMLAEWPSVEVRRGWRTAWAGGPSLRDGGRWLVETAPGAGPDQPDGHPERRVTAVVLERVGPDGRGTGERVRLVAEVFVDATYEGDVALGAGAAYRIGREGREEFGESHAGTIYQDFRGKRCYPGSTGAADRRVQAYNYRLCLTRDPANRRQISRPSRYDRTRYGSLVEDVRTGRVPHFMGWGGVGVLNQAKLPNGKTDCNNHHYCFLSTDWPEENFDYPEAGPERRLEIARAHREYTEGLLWFCQHDSELPESFRNEALEWGYAADEFEDNGGFPRQMYIREAARIVGDHVFTAHDASRAPDGGRAPVFWDSVAAGGYSIDSHATRKREDSVLGSTTDQARHERSTVEAEADGRLVGLEGFLSIPRTTVPYQLPYRIMLPVGIDGLLVPVAVSTTHLGFATIRMEPTWMALGEAAGTAAAVSLQSGVRVRDVPRATLQRTLLKHGQVISFFLDVAPPRFPGHEAQPEELSAAVQFWATRGLFSSYDARPDAPLSTGEAARWVWLVQRNVDPWQTIVIEPGAFSDAEPVGEGAFVRLLAEAFAEPSPLRRSLGLPEVPAGPDGAEQTMARGKACRLLYRTFAPLL